MQKSPQQKLEAAIKELCQFLESKGMIPQGQADKVADQFLNKLDSLDINPRDVLNRESLIGKNLVFLLVSTSEELRLDKTLTLLNDKDGLEKNPDELKAEFKNLFGQLKEKQASPESKKLIDDMQKVFLEEFDKQLAAMPNLEESTAALSKAFLRMELTMDKVSKAASEEEKQIEDAIRSLSGGADTRGISSLIFPIESDAVGNPTDVPDEGDALGYLYVTDKTAASHLDPQHLDNKALVKNHSQAIEHMLTEADECLTTQINIANSPRPEH